MLRLHPKENMLKAEFIIKVGVRLTWAGLSAVGVALVSEVSSGSVQTFGYLVCCWESVYC